MKKLVIAIAALCIGLSANAQQALWGGPSVESPVINADGTVTFRFMAPKAIKVEVTGDFLPTQKMEFEMNGLRRSPRYVQLHLPRRRRFPDRPA